MRFAEQTAEQLVEVLMIVSYSSFHGNVEHNVHIPAPYVVVVGEAFKVSLDRFQQRLLEQIVLT